jgi:hypothetical protein
VQLSWFADFFRALPDAFRALYQFGDPSNVGQGWWGIVIALIWAVPLTAVPLLIAKRTYGRREWVSATMGTVGGLAILWWIFGILPSAWIYFVDSNKEILSDRIIPTSFAPTVFGTTFPVATNLYDVIRDLVVVVEHLIAFGAVFWAASAIQRRYPRTLAPGEDRPEPGGYH